MPLPLFLGIAAGIAGLAGAGAAIDGMDKVKEANRTIERAQSRHLENQKRLDRQSESTTRDMDRLGKFELEIVESFSSFQDVLERIHNRPEFDEYSRNGVKLPKYDGERLREVSVAAGAVLGGLGSAVLGRASGVAAAGVTIVAVKALGTASTGAAIASLKGAAATKATLAALGGGSLATGGGGIALGTTMLGAATLGVGLLVGGVVFNLTGSKLSEQADEAWEQMLKAEEKIDKIHGYLLELSGTANRFFESLSTVNGIYRKHLDEMTHFVTVLYHNDWNAFTSEEKLVTQNTVLLVNLLFNMCNVKLVLETDSETDSDGLNQINTGEVDKNIADAETILTEHSLQ